MATRSESVEGAQPEDRVVEARPVPKDRWGTWFARVVQMCGLVIVMEQVIVGGLPQHHDRLPILAVALAMMLGGVGLQLVLRAYLPWKDG